MVAASRAVTLFFPGIGIEQITRRHTEGFRKLLDNRDRGIASAALDVADIGPVDLGFEAEIFLRHALFAPQSPNVQA